MNSSVRHHSLIFTGSFLSACIDLNITSKVSGSFGTVVNAGNFSQPSESEIGYQATLRASDVSRNKNGQTLFIIFDVIADGISQPKAHISLALQVRKNNINSWL